MRSFLLLAALALPAGSLALSADDRPTSPTEQLMDEVRFVVWGDSQFAHMPVFERMVHETELLRPHFVVQVGDLIQGYTDDAVAIRDEWRSYFAQIEPLTSPFYPVPGNHDVTTGQCVEVYGEVWGRNRFFYTFDEGPVHGIVLDSWWLGEDDRVSWWQRRWLEEELASFAARNGGEGSEQLEKTSIFVFLHSPLWRYRENVPGLYDWHAMHQIFKRYPVRMVVGGHSHEYVHEKIDGIDYVVVNSSGGVGQFNERAGFFHSFLHVSVVGGNDVRAGVVKAGSVLPIDTVDVKERRQLTRYSMKNGALRVPKWPVGEAVVATVSLPITNNLPDQERTFRLLWDMPGDGTVVVDPPSMLFTLPPQSKREVSFRISSEAAPARRPLLRVITNDLMRSGTIPREWEARYLEREASGAPDVIETHIPLKELKEYVASYRLVVPPTATAKRRNGTITIDGQIDEPQWLSTPAVTDITPTNGEKPEAETRVSFLWDDEKLYVAAWMQEPNMAGTKATAGGDIPLTWNDDDFQLYFDPQLNGDYVRLFQNIAGTRFNSKPRDFADKYFQSIYESARDVGPNYWTLEMAIPWSDIYGAEPPAPGTTWRLNIARHRPQSAHPEWQWRGSEGASLYDPNRYGNLVFE